ncbi:G5 domain-containing protein [Cryobacterium sp. MP_3.1]|uniref:G5 domain-containing protein n=1 Tax=Cryobacterium sp. MP_3.1 TaxID=3071711 RepID=UPI003FA38297
MATEAEVQEATAIPFAAVTVDDDTIDVGTSAVTVGGGNGEKVTTYLVKYIDGVEVSRSIAREETTVQPVDGVTSVGTRVPEPVVAAEPVPESNGCDSNYADVCVPIASDVDCAGGSGNGPAYVDGPLRIVGSDVYDLDRDGDGIACDA